MIMCKQCGAEFDETKAACPFCGHLNYIGAEGEYLQHIDDINQNMSDMADDSETEYKSAVKKTVLIIIGVISVVLLLLGLLIGIIFFYRQYTEKKDEESYRASLMWKKEYYDDLDAMYETGKYDEINTFLNEHVSDEGYHPYEWEHMDYMQLYQTYQNFLEDSARFDTMNLTYMYWTLYSILSLLDATNLEYYTLTEEEAAQVVQWQKEAYAFLTDHMELSESEIEDLKKETCYEGQTFPSYSKCKKYIKKRYNL